MPGCNWKKVFWLGMRQADRLVLDEFEDVGEGDLEVVPNISLFLLSMPWPYIFVAARHFEISFLKPLAQVRVECRIKECRVV